MGDLHEGRRRRGAPWASPTPKANGRQQHALLHLPHPHRFEGGRAQAVEKVSRLMISGFY
jgi:hypothetical protein